MSRAVVAIMAIALVGIMSVWGFSAAFAQAGDDNVVINESWTPTAGSVTQLEHSDQTGTYYGNETTVFDENKTEMTRGTDYTWFDRNGTVKALVGGGLDGDASATISYTYQETTSEQRALNRIPAMMPRVLGALLPLLGIAIALRFLTG